MQLGDELVKEQLFFRKELRERVRWLIHLRWLAAGSALVASWLVYYRWRTLPVVAVDLIILFVLLCNIGFHFIWRRLESANYRRVKPFTLFTHAQIICDFLALYPLIYFTGNLQSPLLVFLIFHVILSGMLLSPLSCFLYCFSVPAVLGGIVALQALKILPVQPAMFNGPSWVYRLNVPVDAPEMVPFFLLFVAALFISAFLVTSLKLSLRAKGRALLQVSKALDAGNVKLTALYRMVTEMGGCASLQPLMDVATRNAARIMGVDTCSIKLLDDQREKLIFASTFGLGEEYKKDSQGIEVAGSAITQKIMDGALSVIGKIDEKDYPQYPEDIRKEGIASMICLPLAVGKTVFGMFCVYSAEPGYFSEDDVKIFSLMTDLTALSMENLKRDLDKSWFLQKAAHQLRSPLNTVLSMLNLVKNRYLGPVTPKQATTLDRSVKRLQMLGAVVADLLNLEIKRVDLQKVVLHPVTPARILEPLIEPYQVLADEKHVDVTFDIEKSLPPVLADEKLVDDLFTNLIANAVKYTPVGGAVYVTLSRENSNHVRFQVRDTGIGITPDDIPCIFTEFFRSANARQFVEEGTGLGLVVVKEILDRLKGTISVKSTVGEGTFFTCRLPTADRPSANEDN